MKTNKPLTILAAATALMASAITHAATLAAGSSLIIGSEQATTPTDVSPDYRVSVNANNPGFAALNYRNTANTANGTPFEVDFTEAVQSYRFVNADEQSGTAGDPDLFGNVAESGGLITMTTTDVNFDSFNANAANLWVTNDPGADLLNPTTSRDFQAGIRDIGDVSGSISVSGLASGTVYFFYGNRNGTPTITASMEDTDGLATTLNLANFHNGDFANGNERYMSSLTFVNDAGYDSINYAFTGNSGRWDGIVVTGTLIPEPSSLVLLGLSGLALLRRRRD